jgi:hypothetical protein
VFTSVINTATFSIEAYSRDALGKTS